MIINSLIHSSFFWHELCGCPNEKGGITITCSLTDEERKMIFKNRSAKVFLAIDLCTTVLGYAVQGFAQPPRHHRGRAVVRHPVPKYGRAVVKLSPKHRKVTVRKTRYFFDSGIFYRSGPGGYVVIRAPLGAILSSVPMGSVTFVLRGTTYWYYSGVYYRRVPSGYVVVEAPPDSVIVQESDDQDNIEPAVGERVSVSAHSLNVRSGPGRNHAAARRATQGKTLSDRPFCGMMPPFVSPTVPPRPAPCEGQGAGADIQFRD